MSNATMRAEEAEWQRESDARTLAEAVAIKADPVRLKGAIKASAKMAKEAEEKAKSLRSVSKVMTPKEIQKNRK
jgi:hypothetical protein